MALALSLVLFATLAALFLVAWRASNRAWMVVTPFVLFGLFEMEASWPATVVTQMTGQSLTGAYPALVAGLAFGAWLTGFALVMAVTRYSPTEPAEYRDRPVEKPRSELSYAVGIAVLACLLIGLGTYVYQGLPPFVAGLGTLLQSSNGPNTAAAINVIAAGREQVTKGAYLGAGYRGQGVILEVIQDGGPYLLGLSGLLFVVTRKRRWLAASAALFLLMVFLIAGSGQRWQILAALIAVGITFSLVTRIRGRWLASAAVVMSLIYLGMSLLNPNYQGIEKDNAAVGEFATTALQRIVLGNGLHNVEAMNFLEDGSLQLGLGSIHWQKMLSSIPGVNKDATPFAAQLALLVNPFRPVEDSTYDSQTYLGWLYDDLGLPGSVAVYFVIGAILAFAQGWIFSRPRKLVHLPALALVIYYLGELSLDGPASCIASLIVVAVLWGTMNLLIDLTELWLEHGALRPARVLGAPVSAQLRSPAPPVGTLATDSGAPGSV